MDRPAPFHLRPRSALRDFIRSESAGGVVLMAAAGLALILANSPLSTLYFDALHLDLPGMSLSHWVNDGLMAIFFLLVGLEIKREMLDGQLATWPRRALPGLAALGGMIVPALVYLAINARTPDALSGWAIPSATDIAFALGVLSLLGRRVPVSLKVFLTALAILDDLGAVVIIGLFYTSQLSLIALGGALSTLGVMAGLNHFRVKRLVPYLLLGAVLWWFLLRSGVHPTIAGVLTAFTIPLKLSPATPEATDSPLHRLEHVLQPWVAFLVVPIFGLANAGVAFGETAPAALLGGVPLGVALGLFLGKQLGVFAFSWAAIRLKLAEVPAHATWLQLYGVSILCGVGFTMSLFIGLLAFPYEAERVELLKIGVLAGSGLSALTGALVLLLAQAKAAPLAEGQD